MLLSLSRIFQNNGAQQLASEATVYIMLEDVNDEIPLFTEREQETVLEGEPIGTKVTQVNAIDKDGTFPNNQVWIWVLTFIFFSNVQFCTHRTYIVSALTDTRAHCSAFRLHHCWYPSSKLFGICLSALFFLPTTRHLCALYVHNNRDCSRSYEYHSKMLQANRYQIHRNTLSSRLIVWFFELQFKRSVYRNK